MLEPIDLAQVVHEICVTNLIPNKISPKHDINAHAQSTKFYVDAIKAAEIDATPSQVLEAIIRAAGWDKISAWPGHPHPDKVINELRLLQ